MPAIGIAFSRDRPLQLDGMLRALARQCVDIDSLELTVLHRATSRAQRAAYRAVGREHAANDWVTFVAESDFARDVRDVLGRGDPESLVLFLVDDVLFVRSFALETARTLLGSRSELLGLSLRLGRDTRYVHPVDRTVPLPELAVIDGEGDDALLRAAWPTAEGDLGYPFDLSCSVYRVADVARALDGVVFDGPNLLDHRLWEGCRAFAERRPWLTFHARARGFSLSLNRTQSISPNPTSGLARHEPRALLRAFRVGWRVDVAAYDGLSPPACHFESELLLRRWNDVEDG